MRIEYVSFGDVVSSGWSSVTVSMEVLLRHAGGGDAAAFADLYDLTAPSVLGTITASSPSGDAAERICEQVFLTIWSQAPRFDPEQDSAPGFILRIVRDTVTNARQSS